MSDDKTSSGTSTEETQASEAQDIDTSTSGDAGPQEDAQQDYQGEAGAPLSQEPVAMETTPAQPPTPEQAAALQKEVESLRAQLASLQRHAADLDNIRKRHQRDRERELAERKERVLRGLLPVIDSFHRAIDAMEASTDIEALKTGSRQIYQLFTSYLEKQEVLPIAAVGESYDPNLHEAVMQAPSPDHAEGVVAAEVERGYLIGERVLRHAKVVVSSGALATDGEDEDGRSPADEPGEASRD